MDPEPCLTLTLAQAARQPGALVGGKAQTLGRLINSGFQVPAGFCLTVQAYEQFVDNSGLASVIRMEMGRKPLDEMRWEEIWDAALRIRTAFLSAAMPDAVAKEIARAWKDLAPESMAVRSSAPGEDSCGKSYAGLHESLIGVQDLNGLLDAVRIVWASLWSDAALLYRRELGLDVDRSRMAVVVQTFVHADVSGVAFARDPRDQTADSELVEAVPGLCEDLVSGSVDPDRWVLKRSSGEIVQWTPGQRKAITPEPVLAPSDLAVLHRTLHAVGTDLGYDPDLEWTGRSDSLSVLQARPITGPSEGDTERKWYLSLRPKPGALQALCERVTEDLIPALAAEGRRFAGEELEGLSDPDLAEVLCERLASHEKWKGIYKDEFIPFAHGVRRLAHYYNDAVRPDDPYEFVQILEQQPLLASARNEALLALAARVRTDPALAASLQSIHSQWLERMQESGLSGGWNHETRGLEKSPAGQAFGKEFESFLEQHLDLTFKGEALDTRPDLALGMVLELAAGPPPQKSGGVQTSDALKKRLFAAVGKDRLDEAQEVLRIARLSWQLRDDDNILMGRLEHQLHRALDLGTTRLLKSGRLEAGTVATIAAVETISLALKNDDGRPVVLPESAPGPTDSSPDKNGTSPRQLIGQPAAGGLATGRARIIREASDFADFRHGEVMVCDAIQPTMTHLVPLANAIVERRGGMLIHGAIIARELGVPCVNGVAEATVLLNDGDLLTVDGHLGLVTVGEPEFGLESANRE